MLVGDVWAITVAVAIETIEHLDRRGDGTP